MSKSRDGDGCFSFLVASWLMYLFLIVVVLLGSQAKRDRRAIECVARSNPDRAIEILQSEPSTAEVWSILGVMRWTDTLPTCKPTESADAD